MASATPDPIVPSGDADATLNEALQATSLEEQGRKVFVGNLPLDTTKEMLEADFSVHGTVIQTQLKRRSQPPPFGFVTYASSAEAHTAVEQMNKTTLRGSEITVAIARTPPNARPRGPKATQNPVAAHEGEPVSEESGSTKKPKRKSKKKRTPANAAEGDASLATNGEGNDTDVNELSASGNAPATDGAVVPSNGIQKKARRPRKYKNRSATAATESAAQDGVENTAEDADRKHAGGVITRKFKPGQLPEGEKIKTKLFISNIPFSLTEEGLMEVFKDYQPVEAKLERRYNQRKRVIGFITLANEECQQMAKEKLHKHLVSDRRIRVVDFVNVPKTASVAKEVNEQ